MLGKKKQIYHYWLRHETRQASCYYYWFGTKHGKHHVLFDCVCIQRICLRSFIHHPSIHILPNSPWRSPVTLTNFASMAYRTLGAADLPTCFTTAVHSFWGNRWKWKSGLVNIEECSIMFHCFNDAFVWVY